MVLDRSPGCRSWTTFRGREFQADELSSHSPFHPTLRQAILAFFVPQGGARNVSVFATFQRNTGLAVLVVSCLLFACSPEEEEGPKLTQRNFTFKALGGVSMGAIGASFNVGFEDNHQKVDALVALGGPMDVGYFMGGLERSQLGGFCPLERLEAVAREDAENGSNRLNDPNEPELADCSQRVPGGVAYELEQNFNHWYFEDSGGDFSRDSYLDLFHDLALAMGNPFYWNPDSPVYPHPDVNEESIAGDLCKNPVVIKGLHHKEYNPEGKYDVVTFCDGDEPQLLFCNNEERTLVDRCSEKSAKDFCLELGADSATPVKVASKADKEIWYPNRGRYQPCIEHSTPMIFTLALDLNGNGKRDYHEPVLIFSRERFEDVGEDGCPDEREDGKGGCCPDGVLWCAGEGVEDPNGDNFDLLKNPLGTEGNRVWDPGEPFEDCGLDGVCGTGDFGEGNGKYDYGPNFQRFMDHDFRQSYLQMNEQERHDIAFYGDGGIRDIFNFGLSADHMHSAMRALSPSDSFRYLGFSELPLLPDRIPSAGFNPEAVDFSKVGRNVFVRYGDPDAPLSRQWSGDGSHVGTPDQAAYRFLTHLPWLSQRWSQVLGEPESLLHVVEPEGSPKRARLETYFSEVLNAPRQFGISLPPDYYANPDRRYPVLFFGHGYGMGISDMMAASVLDQDYMMRGVYHPMIVVYPGGTCCYEDPRDQSRDCRERDDEGVALKNPNPDTGRPAFVAECLRGNFYVNRQGYGKGDTSRYGDAIFELMDYVDKNFRTLEPVTVDEVEGEE